jgi:hypothetical protein
MNNPLVSILVLAYNQERYIRDCIRSVLADSYTNLELVLSDDASTDGTFAIMQEEAEAARSAGRRIVLNRNPANLGGLVPHLNRAVGLSQGEILVYCAGDDVFDSQRTTRLVQAFQEQNASVVYSDAWLTDTAGRILGRMQPPGLVPFSAETMCRTGFAGMPGCTAAWRREVFDLFGPLPEQLCNEDDQIGFRGQLLGGLAFVPAPLVYYRLHDAAISGWMLRTEDAAQQRISFLAALDNFLGNLDGWRQAIAVRRDAQGCTRHDWPAFLRWLQERSDEAQLIRRIMLEPRRFKRVALTLGGWNRFKETRNLILFGLVPLLSTTWSIRLYKGIGHLVARRRHRQSLERVPRYAPRFPAPAVSPEAL